MASNIPAHREQILDSKLLFDPDDVGCLIAAGKHALSVGRTSDAAKSYKVFDYNAEAETLRALVTRSHIRPQSPTKALTIVGPSFDKPTGIAVYNRLLVTELISQHRKFQYVDLDALDPRSSYRWLLSNQDGNIIYVMGNNNLYHDRCFTALKKVPAALTMLQADRPELKPCFCPRFISPAN